MSILVQQMLALSMRGMASHCQVVGCTIPPLFWPKKRAGSSFPSFLDHRAIMSWANSKSMPLPRTRSAVREIDGAAVVVGLVPTRGHADRLAMVGDGLVEIAFGPMRVGAHEVDERQLEARLAGVLHEADSLAEIGDGLVRLAHALTRE